MHPCYGPPAPEIALSFVKPTWREICWALWTDRVQIATGLKTDTLIVVARRIHRAIGSGAMEKKGILL